MRVIKNINQFAIVTPNQGATIKIIHDTLNLGPLKMWNFKRPAIFDTKINSRSRPWSMKLAFGWIGDMQFEIIEPKSGQTLYKDYLDKWGHAGIQHLLVDRGILSYSNAKKVLASLGYPIYNEAKVNLPVRIGSATFPALPMILARYISTIFGYTRTLDDLKFAVEISKYPPGLTPRMAIRMGVPDTWSVGYEYNFERLPDNSIVTGIEGFIVLVKDVQAARDHYDKLFGDPDSSTNNSFLYKLHKNYVSIVQPRKGSIYGGIMQKRGEGVQILVATPRLKIKSERDIVFKRKGFNMVELNEDSTLYTHSQLPFQIQVDQND